LSVSSNPNEADEGQLVTAAALGENAEVALHAVSQLAPFLIFAG